MRTTVRLDDDLHAAVTARAAERGVSFTVAFNELLRRGLAARDADTQRKVRRFRQKSYPLGKPKVDLTKALALSFALGDEKIAALMSGQAASTEAED